MKYKQHIDTVNNNYCTGCRACEQLCPVNCIKMKENNEGFIYPEIDEHRCINCGKCKAKCPQLNQNSRAEKQEVFAVKARNIDDSQKSTSAGIAYILYRNTIENGGIVFGCMYNEELIPMQVKIEENDELYKLRGSKYVFSNTMKTYTEVKECLLDGRDVLYIGTPCQIAGLYAYLGKEYEKLLTADIVCHGVPSPKIFKKYIEFLQIKYKKKVIGYEFRNKDRAIWGEYQTKIIFEDNSVKYVNADDDPYYSNFLSGTMYRESCYNCKYANYDRIGDITLADFWGIEKVNPKFYSKKGVSLVICNTQKGKDIIKEIEENIIFVEQTEADAKSKNKNLSVPTSRKLIRDIIYKGIDYKTPEDFINTNLKVERNLKKVIKKIIPKNIKIMIKKIM